MTSRSVLKWDRVAAVIWKQVFYEAGEDFIELWGVLAILTHLRLSSRIDKQNLKTIHEVGLLKIDRIPKWGARRAKHSQGWLTSC